MNITVVKVKTNTLLLLVLAVLPIVGQASQIRTYTYNALGLVETIDGPRTDVSDITDFTYDAKGNLTLITNPLGHNVIINSLDAHGRPLSVTGVNGVTTSFVYTNAGLLESSHVHHPSDSHYPILSSYFEYDGLGQMTKTIQPNGTYLIYSYDESGRVTAIQNEQGERLEYGYDTEGNVTHESIKNNQSVEVFGVVRVFDELSRLKNMLQGTDITVEYHYDANNNAISLLDGRANTTSQAYDSLNRLITTVDPLLGETHFAYDRNDRLTSVTDARNMVTRYQYDPYGNVLEVNSADTGISSFTYDAAGNMLSAQDANNNEITYSYDALNRLTHVNYINSPAENITYSYDHTGQGNFGVGQLTQVSDPSGSTTIFYDYRGLVTEKHHQINGINYHWHYTYNASGQLISLRYPSGRVVRYERDHLGRMSAVYTQSWEGSLEQLVAYDFIYLPFGGITSFTYGNGVQNTIDYDQYYRLQNMTTGGISPLMDLSFSYDLSGNINLLSDSVSPQLDQLFSYDPLSRLDTANGAYGIVDFDYDAVGNRVQKEMDQNNTIFLENYHYAADSNRLNDKTDNTGTHLFSYDNSGNITNDASRGVSFAYNHANRPYLAITSTSNTAYTYNAYGQRAVKAVTISGSTNTTHYQYDGPRLVTESNAQGMVLREYIYADGALLAITDRNSEGDIDADGLDDDWELQFFGDLSRNGTGDFDSDGINDASEFIAGSIPTLSASTPSSRIDSDNDGLRDSWEIAHFGDLSQTGGGDPDGDNIANINEFEASYNPTEVNVTEGSTGTRDLNYSYPANHLAPANTASEITLSNNNLMAHNPNAYWRSSIAISPLLPGQKYYWEVEVLDTSVYSIAGIASDAPLNSYVGSSSGSYGWQTNNVYHNSAGQSFDAYPASLRLMIAFDPDAGKLWFGQNGVWNGDPEAGAGAQFTGITGKQYPAISAWNTAVSLIFDSAQFSYTPPTGYEASRILDSDNDGLLDGWESHYFQNLYQTGTQDSDGDGLTNEQEHQHGTNPTDGNSDSDSDDLPDSWELQYFGSLEYSGTQDFDNDGVSNGDEYLAGTSPTSLPSDSTLAFTMEVLSGATLFDVRGSHNAEVYGTQDVAGIKGDALEFDTTNDRIEVPHHADLNPTGDYAISMWMRFTGNNYGLAFGKFSFNFPYAGPIVFANYANNTEMAGRIQFQDQSAESYQLSSASTNLNDNTWRHYVFQRQGNVLQIWIDGTLDVELTLPTVETFNNTNPLYIMGRPGLQLVTGAADQVDYWSNRALSNSEINALSSINTGGQ